MANGVTDLFYFFGFVTSSNAGVITNVSVITYNENALFNSKFD